VAFIVKEDEFLYPEPVSFFGSGAIVFGANGVMDLIDKLGLTQWMDLRALISLTQERTGLSVDIKD
jgi:hypothetical protein